MVHVFLHPSPVNIGCSVVSDSLWPCGLYPNRLLCPWNFPGENTGVGCHFLLQGIFLSQGLNLGFLHCQQIVYGLSYQGGPSSTTKHRSKSTIVSPLPPQHVSLLLLGYPLNLPQGGISWHQQRVQAQARPRYPKSCSTIYTNVAVEVYYSSSASVSPFIE